MTTKSDRAALTLRLPRPLYDVLKAQAERNKRSISAEVEFQLEPLLTK